MQDTNGKPINRVRVPFLISLLGIAVVSSILKIALLIADVIPFNADEAIVGLMAHHFLNGEWDVFFYGQAYMGSLDATLVAALFALFGSQIVLIRIVQILLYIGTILTTGYLGLLIFKSERVGYLAAIFMAIPTVNVTLYTTVSLGGYGEVLLIGNLLIIAAMKIYLQPKKAWYLLWGFCAGLGIWAFGLTLIYVLPTFILLVYKIFQESNKGERTQVIALSTGAFFLGLSPWITWAISNGFSPLFQELFGSAISGASSSNPFLAIVAHFYNLLLFGTTVIFGLRPSWEIRWLAQPLLPFTLAFWLFILVLAFRNLSKQDDSKAGRWVLAGVMITLVTGFVFTPFGADPSGRYFLPFMIILSLVAGEFCVDISQRSSVGRWSYLLPALILIYNLWGTVQAASRFPPGLTTQFDSVSWIDHRFDDELIDFLRANGEVRGYSNYWVSYPIAFQSDEEIIYIPSLPYHQDFRYTSRDNRYQPYNDMVEESDRVAYITTNHAALDEFLTNSFESRELTWEEKWIGDYHVFYRLSEIVRPLDLGIYELQPED